MTKPTQLLPRQKGIPYTHDEIIQFMANLDDALLRDERFHPKQEPLHHQEIIKAKSTKVFTNWVVANIKRESRLFVNP